MPYEQLEHTSDVMLHCWADELSSVLEDSVRALFSILVPDLSAVTINESLTFDVEATGVDLAQLLYHVLDEFLYSYGATYTITAEVRVFEVRPCSDEDCSPFIARARGWGGRYDPIVHAGGTEVKAVTMHNLSLEHRMRREGESNAEGHDTPCWHATFVLDI